MNTLRSLIIGGSLLLFMSAAALAQDEDSDKETMPLRVISQPKAIYTERARNKGIEGAVRLKITLLANGQVGTVTVVKTKGWKKMEKYGLSQRAIDAAKQIQFSPKVVDGVPISMIVIREYTFSIY